MRKFFICWGLFVFAWGAEAYTSGYYSLAQGEQRSESFERFQKTLQNSQSKNLEEFLREWKIQDPDVFRFYLLSYRSRSLQEASFQAPRAVLFSPIGDFMASFNGHKEQKGSQNLEVIRFNHEDARFEFYELGWSANGLELSAPNPQKCLDCHQSLAREGVDPRPNWEPYFLWPGFYGSPDSQLLNSVGQLSSNQRQRLSTPQDAFILEEIGQEKEQYGVFWDVVQPTHERYSLLTRYTKEEGYADAQVYGAHAAKEIRNSHFTQRVTQYNFLRVARLMGEDQEFFDFFKEALFAVLQCSPSVLPLELNQWLYMNSSLYNKHQREQKVIEDAYGFNLLELGDRLKLLFEPFYFETDDWSMDFKTEGRFAFSTRFGTPGHPEAEFKAAFATRYPEFLEYKAVKCSSEEWKQQLALKYSNISLVEQAQKKRESFKRRIDAVKNTPLIQRCARCHDAPTSADIPMIAFSNELVLKTQLQQGGYARGRLFDEIVHRTSDQASSSEQMPPRGVANVERRKELVDYLRRLMP